MPQIDTITIRGFKSIAAIESLALGPINLVIGPNGSGKSNFVGAFAFFQAIREGRLREYVIKSGGANRILHFGAKTTPKVEINVSLNEEVNQYVIALGVTANDQLYPSLEQARYWNKGHQPPFIKNLESHAGEAGISDTRFGSIAGHLRDQLGGWRLYHFHDTGMTSPMRGTSDINDNRYLRPDGSNLPSFLNWIRENNRESYNLIRGSIARMAPFFDDFALEPQKLNPETIRLEWRHKGSDAYFDASSLSDGTLRFIALATLFLQPGLHRPPVILVDEPELGLHPYAIGLLASMIKQASISSQVIVSTQSPLLLDYFQPEDVLVADRVNGGTQLTRLESAKLATWLEDYSLGQLWEKNEFGGRP